MDNVNIIYYAKIMGAVLLPLIGIAIVLFALLAFVLPFGLSLKDTTQKIKGFGLDLQVSVLALFVLIGLTLSLTGIYLITQDYESKIEELTDYKVKLQNAEHAFKQALAQARQVDVQALITLNDAGAEGSPDPQKLRCKLFIFGDAQPRDLRVEKGIQKGEYSVWIDNMNAGTIIRRLVCEDPDENRKWTLEKFNPLNPEYSLARSQS